MSKIDWEKTFEETLKNREIQEIRFRSFEDQKLIEKLEANKKGLQERVKGLEQRLIEEARWRREAERSKPSYG